jgi:dihydrolipoamide dehydrogenase
MTYDVIVIGSGPGGYVAAIRAAQLGLKTACIEKSPTLGGTCLNVGCIPSKALLHTTEVYTSIQEEEGLHAKPTYDFSAIMARKEKVVLGFTKGIEGLFKKNKIDWIQGSASFKDPNTLSVANQTLQAKSFILATGSEPIPLPFLPFDETVILSSTGALALKSVPKKLLIVGAGVIGVELGSVYARLGSEVTFIEFLDRICPTFDSAISKGLQKSLEAQKMAFHLSHKVLSASRTTLNAEGPSGPVSFTGDAILVSIGRRPNTQSLNLEAARIQKDPKGFIPINASFQTSQPHIFAIGDVVDGPMLAHKASEEGVAVAELLAGLSPKVDYLSIPNVVYTHPEAAAVGLTQEELTSRSIPHKVSLFPLKASSRARCINAEDGFVKILAETSTSHLLGVHILGASASELINTAALAIKQRMTAKELAETCFAHPTLSEAIKEAALGIEGKPIHL